MTSWRGPAWGLLAMACGAPVEGEPSEWADLGEATSELSSNGPVTSAFPAVVSISTVCTATKIDAGKFLTAPECAERLTNGSVLRYTNHPLGLDDAPASAIRSGRVKTTRFMATNGAIDNGLFLAVIELQDLHTDDYPSMPIAPAFLEGPTWFTQVGYGNDQLDAEQGKQTARFKSMSRAEFYGRVLERFGEDSREVWIDNLPAWTNDDERPSLDDDTGGPALVQSGGVWRVVGVYRKTPLIFPVFRDMHYVRRVDGLNEWFQSAYEDLPLPTRPSIARRSFGCFRSLSVHEVDVAADRGFRFESQLKVGTEAFRTIRNDDARTFGFSIAAAGGAATLRVRACNVTGCGPWTSTSFNAPACAP